jgi:DNA processing protein
MSERDYWLGFSTISGIGPAKFKKLLAEFKTAKCAWEAKKFDFSIKDYLEELKKKDVWFITLQDESYPELLKEIKNPPFVLYGKGNASLLNNKNTIAVVGARRTTQYGREVTKLLTTELILNGFVIVSGLALGVDAVSHMTALENNGSPRGEAGRTIAVLGCGVDCCNPRENQSIYDEILKSGNCIVSEFPLGMKPTQWTFPARNRIIAGLSQAVLVTEGAEDSGSLITAKFALRFGRRVFAVPGPITSSMSKGPYVLIQKGAKLVTSGEDILKELKIINSKSQIPNKSQISKFKTATKDEVIILKFLENEPLHFDELVRRTKFKSSQLSSILSVMEIKGLIKSADGGSWQLNAS